MDRPNRRKTRHSAFTLVEMLVVIVIIGILVGLTAAGLAPARRRAREAVIMSEVTELGNMLTQHKIDHNAFPPVFIDINVVDERGDASLQPLQDDARNAVVRHLREMFPRYTPGGVRGTNNPAARPDSTPFEKFANDVYYYYMYPVPFTGVPTVDPLLFDSASSLVFWLGGLPELPFDPTADSQWIPAGFHSDPEMPFKPGTPRTEPLLEFDPERIVFVEEHYSIPWDTASAPVFRQLHYYPKHVKTPYVYFKSRRRGARWQYGSEAVALASGGTAYVPYSYYHAPTDGDVTNNICVAYRDPQNPPFWREQEKFQILVSGLDNLFGTVGPTDAIGAGGVAQDHGGNPVYRTTETAGNFSDYDYDNLANFSGGRLGDEIE